jgi:phosphatidylinositol alpha-1,6-mannosyltransferase
LIVLATQCFSPDPGGIESLMTGLADALARDGRAVEVFADHIRSRELAELARPYPIRRFGALRPLRRAMKRRAIARAIAADRLTGLFADSWKSVGATPASAAPLAVLAHGTEYPLEPSPARAARIREALARVSVVIASSHYTASLVDRFTRGTATRLVVINPPVADLPAAAPAALAALDAAIAGRGPVVATLARLEPRKGVDSVLRALPALRLRHPGLVYCVGGAGADLARLRALAASLGVADRVVFLGQIDDPATKAALLTRADVHAMPSRRVGASVEGFGIAYVEAGWYGAPSIAGDDGGSADAVVHERTGLICDGASAESVAAALARLLDDDDLRRRLGAEAAAQARARHTWAVALPRYLEAIAG